MNIKEANKVLEELHEVDISHLEGRAKRLFDAIMCIADERDELLIKNKKLEDEIKELELIVGLRQKRNLISKFDKEYDEEDKKKNPNRDYAATEPDAEEVYKRYYKQKEQLKQRDKIIDDIKEIIDRYNLGKYDYSIPQIGIIELLELLQKYKDSK